MENVIYEELSKQGFKARILSVDHLAELQDDIKSVCERNILSDKYNAFLNKCFDFSLPKDMQNAFAIIVAAVPSPRVSVIFNYKGKRVPLFIPPTYVDMFSATEQVVEVMKGLIEPQGYSLIKAKLPQKLLAVRSGLGAYGRNNICYIPGMGSFARLATFFSDIPCHEDNWHEVKQMSSCANCNICSKKCPTGAISKEKTLINAERCICYINEHKGEFPDWLDISWHNSIVGCFLCQEACPQNKNHIDQVVELGEFSQEETAMLLGGEPLQNIPSETKIKVEKLGMGVYYSCLSRNLKVLLE